ncbi:MAG: quercetin 2,3-dioxygenase [Desulfuromonas sp.]|uniref:pirin family protein n=1 Tax=Desulfuromonas sp. TaxID=892 RepID=UPI000CAC9ABF|nr:pirin family protein [Desulfuromonas sp.]PLX82823.1 MAG: quercetin 2,3-dioxygenase [Desulfuromonas sp.]
MITVRRSEERGRYQQDWLDSRHTFSFDTYQDPRHTGFRKLRVINEDRVEAGGGFPLHPHRDMEIVSIVIEGALKHQDSLGHEGIIEAGQLQRITAGNGVRHSEYNPSDEEPVHFLQIWIFPDAEGLKPSYETKDFSDLPANTLRPVATRDGRLGSATIHQDVSLYLAKIEKGKRLDHQLDAERHAWVQVVDGAVELNGTALQAGDGAAVSEERILLISAVSHARFLLFDLN